MSRINKPTDEERKLALEPPVRYDIVRVLGTQMFCLNPKPTKELCTEVAKALVKKYPLFKDTGDKVSGYVCMYVLSVRLYTTNLQNKGHCPINFRRNSLKKSTT